MGIEVVTVQKVGATKKILRRAFFAELMAGSINRERKAISSEARGPPTGRAAFGEKAGMWGRSNLSADYPNRPFINVFRRESSDPSYC